MASLGSKVRCAVAEHRSAKSKSGTCRLSRLPADVLVLVVKQLGAASDRFALLAAYPAMMSVLGDNGAAARGVWQSYLDDVDVLTEDETGDKVRFWSRRPGMRGSCPPNRTPLDLLVSLLDTRSCSLCGGRKGKKGKVAVSWSVMLGRPLLQCCLNKQAPPDARFFANVDDLWLWESVPRAAVVPSLPSISLPGHRHYVLKEDFEWFMASAPGWIYPRERMAEQRRMLLEALRGEEALLEHEIVVPLLTDFDVAVENTLYDVVVHPEKMEEQWLAAKDKFELEEEDFVDVFEDVMAGRMTWTRAMIILESGHLSNVVDEVWEDEWAAVEHDDEDIDEHAEHLEHFAESMLKRRVPGPFWKLLQQPIVACEDLGDDGPLVNYALRVNIWTDIFSEGIEDDEEIGGRVRTCIEDLVSEAETMYMEEELIPAEIRLAHRLEDIVDAGPWSANINWKIHPSDTIPEEDGVKCVHFRGIDDVDWEAVNMNVQDLREWGRVPGLAMQRKQKTFPH